MNTKLLAVLAVFFALAGVYLYPIESATGFLIDDGNISVNIKAIYRGQIMFLDYAPMVETYEYQYISTGVANTGSTTYLEHIEIQILDYNLSVLATFTSDYNTLMPMDSATYSMQYMLNKTGYYWIYVKVPFADTYTDAWGLYFVNGTDYVPPIIVPGLPPSTPPPATETPEGTITRQVGSPSMTLDYPQKIIVNQNQSTIISVAVKNTGNRPLTGIILPVTSIGGIKFDVIPKLLPELQPGMEGIFLISLDVPETQPLGTYALDFYVRSKEVTEKGHTDVLVKLMPVADELSGEILNYAILLKRIMDDARNATLDGKNTTLVIYNIGEGERILEDARKSFAARDYDGTRNTLRLVKSHIETAVLELARARRTVALHAVFPFMSLLLLLIALAITVVLLFEHKRQKEKKKKEKEEGTGTF